ncbi:MAG: hypothetical protein WCK04_05870 [Actinomycetes bacterium]
MRKIYLVLLFCAAMAFAGCQTPLDRIALSTLNTSDAAVDTAYHAWLSGWKDRRAHEGSSPALLTERNKVAALVSRYQSAHRTAIKTAEAAVNSGVTEINLTELSALKGELINVLTHR